MKYRLIVASAAVLLSAGLLYEVLSLVLKLINAIYAIPAEIGYTIMRIF
jgi:hypothetical protein